MFIPRFLLVTTNVSSLNSLDPEEAVTQGNDLDDALYPAQDVLNTWLTFLKDTGKKIPPLSNIKSIELDDGQFANLILADTDAWRLLNSIKAAT